MDKIKGFINDLTGGDGNLDANDLSNAAKDVNVDDLKNQAENLGLGDMNLDLLTSLEFPLTKEEVVSQLKAAGANGTLVSIVEQVPDQVYGTLNELREKLPI